MTAGRGIAHSERTPQEMRAVGSDLFGIQSWVALPAQYEETEPTFAHHGANELPVIEDRGKRVRLICGSLYGASSPVRLLSDMFYAEVILEGDARLQVPTDYKERAAYLVEGSIATDRETFHAGQLIVFKPGSEIILSTPASGQARLMLLGGDPLEGRRHIWWNFVSSSPERIEQAKDDWKSGRFSPVIDETEFIPLPETGPVVVRYP
jgi:redox-sensitive bicupin YhaK (pirin superfamily)